VKRRVCSMWQSWATLCVAPLSSTGRPAKRHETRAFAPRAPLPIDVVIHATKKWDRDNAETATDPIFRSALRDAGYLSGPTRGRLGVLADPNLKPLPLGKIIGVATIVSVVHLTQRLGDATPEEHGVSAHDYEFGDWTPGRYAWRFNDTFLLPEPIPFKGRQDVLYLLDDATQALVDEQLQAATV
jgi:hypothetical protein